MTITLQTWKRLLRTARAQKGYTDPRGRTSHELTNVNISFPSLSDVQNPLRTVRSIGWIYPSDDELESIILEEATRNSFATLVARQLPNVVLRLTERPTTRRAVMHFIQPHDFPLDAEFVPSFISAQFLFRNGCLHTTIFLRSVDLLFGLPAHLVQGAILARHVAKQASMSVGSLTCFITSAHVFSEYDAELERVLGERIVRV